MRSPAFWDNVHVMVPDNVQTIPHLSHEERAVLVDELWNGIRRVIDLIDLPDQRQALMLDLEKHRRVIKPVCLRTYFSIDEWCDICLE